MIRTVDDYEQEEVLDQIKPTVSASLKYRQDINSRGWWPTDYFSFMQQEDYKTTLDQFRGEGKEVSDSLLVVLVGNTITEEALPNYSSRLSYLSPDPTGISNNPWNVWSRAWTAEEDTHGKVLHNYLLLTGRVNMKSVERSIFSLLSSGFEQSPDLFQGVFYPMFQEIATQRSHLNLAKNVEKKAPRLYTICSNIAKDEQRHAMFYQDVGEEIFNVAPDHAMISYYELLRGGIVMPARLMTDGVYTEAPTLYDKFSEIAVREGIYVPEDYAQIIERLNDKMNIETRSVTGRAAFAQEKMGGLPNKIRKIGTRKLRNSSVKDPIEFEWIHGRAA